MKQAEQAQIGVVGLGVMGASLARNFHSRGLCVAGYTLGAEARAEVEAAWGDEHFRVHDDLRGLVADLARPRCILVMVPAGAPVDDVLDGLIPLLDTDDVVVDGGNSYWADTDRRADRLASHDLHFVGMGVSGGQEGALRGPAMMPGGSPASWSSLRPLLEPAAAVSDSGPCVAWCGHRSAGHAVKMVHNGIEYGDMQLISEIWSLLRHGLGQSPAEQAETFARWNDGRLESYLVQITADIVGAADPAGDGEAHPLVDRILDVAGQKGTGRWTVRDAVESGVAVPTIAAAVDGRVVSARKSDRARAAGIFAEPLPRLAMLCAGDLEAALYAAKLMSYSQGFDLLRAQSVERGYDTDLAGVSRIWKSGCIIRAAFLDRVHSALADDPALPLLVLAPGFAAELRQTLPSWRRVVGAAIAGGYPVPALAASLMWFDSLRQARGTASLIQAQRDYFGAHTFRRVDAPDEPVHVDWRGLARMG